ncbi:CheR family methyltransferase [Methylocystis parvus]|uniref:CheR family methyltransferase n=1 Tax=Methylocystis parvus TaxID=134 RepID=UPI0002DF42B8|nr:protein-glutamate O-methyltransferase CheR [Methylocystis parvus]WBK01515.1 protein-glutamate O-methyltransferase CheR [Methylocystis parvus OBBP]
MNFVFARFRRQLAALTGIALGADKQYLAESRLAPVARAHGLADFASLVDAFERQENPQLTRDAIDAMTTNETLFFRDRTPFENFRAQALPELIASRANERRLRFWCAACSTGQEAYSLAMTLDQDAAALRGWTLEVLATDLSTAAVEAARVGSYSQFEVQRGLSTSQLLRYFHREEESWRVNEHLRARIDFRDFNLLSDYAELGTFDVIFCRNVLMYFEPDMKRAVLARLSQALNEGGYLFLGAAEPTNEANAYFTKVTQDGVWRARRRGAPQLRLA